MSNLDDKLNIEELKRLNSKKIELGTKIESFVKSDGFLILKVFLKNFENDIKDKSDYESLENFKADRKAIEIVQGLLVEFENLIHDAKQASSELNKLIEAESSTPSILSLDGEGIEEGQQSDSE